MNFRSELALEFEAGPRVVQVQDGRAALLRQRCRLPRNLLEEGASSHSTPAVIVDLARVDFVDSQGLRLLLTYWRRN